MALHAVLDMPSSVDLSDELDIAALFAEHGAFIANVIRRLVGPGGDVDDLVQETFLVAYRKRGGFDPERAAPRTWLYGIAANLCRRHHRGAGRLARLRARLLVERSDGMAAAPDREVLHKQRAAVVHQALAKLPFKQREVFALYELQGLDGASIAAMLDIPEGTVWTRLHHARKRFERQVRARLGGDSP